MDAGVKWTPYLEKMKGLIDPLQPAALTEWQGKSLAPAREFARGQVQGGCSAYRADKLEKMVAEARRRDPEGRNVAPQGSPEFERRHAALYRALRERDQANSANEMAELAQKRAARKKPATHHKGA